MGRSATLRNRLARGFTLIELLVSITIGLIIMVALISVYLNVSRTNSEMSKTNSMIESGRYSIDVLQEDVEHAGFWGGYVPVWDDFAAIAADPNYQLVTDTATPANLPNPCLAYSTANWTTTYTYAALSMPVQSFSAIPTGCTMIDHKVASTDVLVVRHAELCSPGVGNCEALDTAKAYFQPTFCASEITTATPSFFVGISSALTLHKRDCTTVSDLRRWVSNVYYVRDYSTTVGDGIPTLWRVRFDGNAYVNEALIEGVDSFVVDLGIDSQNRCANNANYSAVPTRINPSTCLSDATATNNTMPNNRGDGVPESYVHCGAAGCTIAQLRDVVAVKLFLLARTHDAGATAEGKSFTLGSVTGGTVTVAPSASDKYRRHLFQQSIRLNNVSGRRESP